MWYGITLTIGLLLLAFGIYRFKNTIDFINNSWRISATVIDSYSYKDSDGDILHQPIFEYSINGREYKFRYKVGTNPPSWRIGEKTQFAIDPNFPDKPIVLTYFGAFSWSIISIAISLPLIFVGASYSWAINFFKNLMVI